MRTAVRAAPRITFCMPSGPPISPSLTSNPFSSGQFMVSFQAMIPSGPPERITRAGLNQRQTTTDSFFDVYFEVDVGGTLMEAALGLHAEPSGPPNSPATLVTDRGKIRLDPRRSAGHPQWSTECGSVNLSIRPDGLGDLHSHPRVGPVSHRPRAAARPEPEQ